MNPSAAKQNILFTGYQKFVIAILAFLQFTIILDFMIISPLGAFVMPDLSVSPSQFGLIVSGYAFSAGASGLLAAGFADKYDRKKLLLLFYVGFLIGTLLCGLAHTYQTLLFARIVTGIFGGVLGSIVFTITTDLFDFSLRGRVMGFIQTAFAGSQVLGLPLGIYLANQYGWHAPFFMIVGVSAVVGVVILLHLKPIDGHLKLQTKQSSVQRLVATFSNRKYLIAFTATALITAGGFMLMPFSSTYLVRNLGVSIDQLPLIYLFTGCFTLFVGPAIGKASDRFGKFRVFTFGAIASIIMILIYTHLTPVPLAMIIFLNILMFVSVFSRMIPAQALMSAIPSPEHRGSFMSVNSSMQQVSGGIASVLAGLIIYENADHSLGGLHELGYVIALISLGSLWVMYFVHKIVSQKVQD
jgi:predicted MFS family arabinose efflux permease